MKDKTYILALAGLVMIVIGFFFSFWQLSVTATDGVNSYSTVFSISMIFFYSSHGDLLPTEVSGAVMSFPSFFMNIIASILLFVFLAYLVWMTASLYFRKRADLWASIILLLVIIVASILLSIPFSPGLPSFFIGQLTLSNGGYSIIVQWGPNWGYLLIVFGIALTAISAGISRALGKK